MSGIPRLRALGHAALCVVGVVLSCMPERVEVGRDSTLDVSPAGEAGSGASTSRASGGASGADAGQSGAESPSNASAQGGTQAEGGASSGGPPSSGAGGSAGSAELACPNAGAGAVLWSLDTFCKTFGCASSVEAAKVYLLSQYSDCSGLAAEVSDGCGRLVVSVSGADTGGAYVFEGDPPRLVGASIHRAVPWGPCDVERYFGGVMPESCAAATTCTFCGAEGTCAP